VGVARRLGGVGEGGEWWCEGLFRSVLTVVFVWGSGGVVESSALSFWTMFFVSVIGIEVNWHELWE
jgi:hypothetical protein